MEIALISDTHIPSRAARLPDWVRERVREADHVIHAGDVDSPDALAAIEDVSRELTVVSGNMDAGLDLPAVATLERGGVEFVVTHGTGSKNGYERRVASTVRDHASADPVVGVSGHTHEPMDATVDGVRLLNPGSATGAAPAPRASMLIAQVEDGDLSVEVLER